MTHKVMVTLEIPQLKQSNCIYCLENIENIIKQLFEKSGYSVSLGNNREGALCTSLGLLNLMFEVNMTIPKNMVPKIEKWNIFGKVNLSKVVESQLEIKGNLVDTTLLGYKGSEIEIGEQLPKVAVSLKKIFEF